MALLSIDAQEIVTTVTLAMRQAITATQLRGSTEARNEVFDNGIS